MIKRIFFILLAVLLTTIGLDDAEAKKKGRDGKKSQGATLEQQQAQGLLKTGLVPVYPSDATCLEVSSHFGDQTRYDGSRRVLHSNNGYHGGMDITVEIGTPLVAMADGEIIHKGTGGMLTGHVVWMRHSPEETGLGVWTFTKYQHLDKPTELKVGDRVKMGETVGLGGRTGTVGGHYGAAGYPHLHMNVYMNKTGDYSVIEGTTKVRVHKFKRVDPLAVYYGRELNSNVLKDMPASQKTFPIPYLMADGKVVPPDTNLVWPIACDPR